MEIETKLSQLFTVKDVPDTAKDTNSTMELKKIETQLNDHMRQKKGLKYERVSITSDKSYDASKFTVVIDNEITETMEKKKWKSLPLFMRWNLVASYMSKNNITDFDTITQIKSKLTNNTLQVKYENKQVVEILE